MTSAILPPTELGERYSWSHWVHLRLGEQLYYYVVNIRPYRHEEASKKFDKIIEAAEIGSIHVFSIFGRHDLLVQVWLDPEAAKTFPAKLQEISTGAVNAYPFVVTDPMFRSTDPTDTPLEYQQQSKDVIRLLNQVNNKRTIRSLERGEDEALLKSLLTHRLIYENPYKDENQRLQFFVAITPEDRAGIQTELLATAVRNLAVEELAIDNFALDFGFGFCSMLCKGVVKLTDYFRITTFLRGIARLVPWGISTETLLVNETGFVARREYIGEATYVYLRGKDLTALQTIPEIYGPQFRKVPEAQIRKIEEVLQERDLSDEERDFIHDYLLGVLNDEPKERSKSLAGFFIDLEYFLRGNYRAFAGRLTNDIRKVKEQAGLQNKEELTLGDLLSICSMAIKISGDRRFERLIGGWESLANVRNAVVHGAQSFLDDWETPLRTVLDHLDRIRQLKSYIYQVLGGQTSE